MIEHLIRGATITSDICIALFFFRFWTEKRDKFFLHFACAFSLIALSTFAVVLLGKAADFKPFAYGLRLLAYLLIIFAIINKNRPEKSAD
ncbi:MAG: hypothetical protein K2X77_01810 [Candidatus Obscuribacterales bacterium]|nr:hypothetical protein [Candidatus Obscuribacterales bacterium]